MSTIVSYAQNREDILLEAFFPEVKEGFYVDVGANHPVNDSVTKRFYDKGWRGINIEPNKKLWQLLRNDRPRDINLQLGVSNKNGEFLFREYKNHGLSTFSSDMKASYEKSKQPEAGTQEFLEYKVPVTMLREIFDDHVKGRPIHFLKIDIEGYEYEALEANDWKKYRPMMICIESNHIVRDWRPLLKKHGYEKVFFDGLNDYYLAKEELRRHDLFDYPRATLVGRHVVTLGTYKQLNIRDKKIASLQQVIEQQKRVLQNFRMEKNELEVRLKQRRRIRQQAKELLKSFDRAFIDIIGALVRQKYPRSLTATKVEAAKSLKAQLTLAQQYDQGMLHVNFLRKGLYLGLILAYRIVRKIFKLLARAIWYFIKLLKRMIKR